MWEARISRCPGTSECEKQRNRVQLLNPPPLPGSSMASVPASMESNMCFFVQGTTETNTNYFFPDRYNYSKEDEEMFKEFYEIANVFIPNILKQSSPLNEQAGDVYKPADDPQFFAYLLQFYDGICLWEEGSHIPVLHADWAKKLVQSISKISPSCRAAFSSTKGALKQPRPLAPGLQSSPTIPEKKLELSHQAPEAENSEQNLRSSQQAPIKDGMNNATGTATEKVGSSNEAFVNNKGSAEKRTAVALTLKSTKMKEMRDLLTNGGKLNTSAIKLQLTAQSQVSVPKNRRRSSFKTDDYVYDFDEEAEGDQEEDEEEEEEEEEEDPWAKRPRLGMYPTFYP